MKNQKDTPPKFDNDHDALVFLIENFNFEGGSIVAGGMGPEIEIEMDETAPEWASRIADAFMFYMPPYLDNSNHGMPFELLSCTLSRQDSKLFLTRYWSDPIMGDWPCVRQPRVLQKAIVSILGVKSICRDDNMDTCKLKWDRHGKSSKFVPDTSDFVMYDAEGDDVSCNKTQALKILEVLKMPKMIDRKYWSSFKQIDSITLTFSLLSGAYHFCFTGENPAQDVTKECLQSKQLID